MTEIRPLELCDAVQSARIHNQVLGMEFLARFGPRFLTTYHRAWIDSPAGLAFGSYHPNHGLIGVVLASLDPASHYRWMLAHRGPQLAVRLVGRSLKDPVLGRDLIATRGSRYARAVWRQMAGRTRSAPAAPVEARSGEVTHLMVSPEARGTGAGAGLVNEVERWARAAGVQELVLVTPPGLESRHFYDHLGWEATGRVTSRSGELFIRYTRHLSVTDRRPDASPTG